MMTNASIVKQLVKGDKRSLTGVTKAIHMISKNPDLIGELLSAVSLETEAYNMRALDTIEKATRDNPVLLKPYKNIFIKKLIQQKQKKIRWHVAQIIPRLKLTNTEQQRIITILINDYLNDSSSIVKVNSLQALADLAISNKKLGTEIKTIVKKASKSKTPALAARAKKLLVLLCN